MTDLLETEREKARELERLLEEERLALEAMREKLVALETRCEELTAEVARLMAEAALHRAAAGVFAILEKADQRRYHRGFHGWLAASVRRHGGKKHAVEMLRGASPVWHQVQEALLAWHLQMFLARRRPAPMWPVVWNPQLEAYKRLRLGAVWDVCDSHGLGHLPHHEVVDVMKHFLAPSPSGSSALLSPSRKSAMPLAKALRMAKALPPPTQPRYPHPTCRAVPAAHPHPSRLLRMCRLTLTL